MEGARLRVGLVLGGGGIRGAAWMIGALHGLVGETGWDPASANLMVGTSAGAVVAALTLGGARPWDLLVPGRGEFFQELMDAAAFRPELTLGSFGPGSLQLAARALRGGSGRTMKLVAGLLPGGFISTAPIARMIKQQAPGDWPRGLWVVATDHVTGRRTVFGRDREAPAELSVAVAASCAIPGFYRPVRVGGRFYVDGGVHGGANLDLAAGEPLDLVICANPLSSPAGSVRSLASPLRAALHRELEVQVRAVERAGTPVVVLEPAGESIHLIGLNPMSRTRGAAIGKAASEEVQRYLGQPAMRRLLAPLADPRSAA
jgi:NTE family protein